MKTAVITGGSGYVGSAVTEMLIKNDYLVINLGRTSTNGNTNTDITTIQCDLSRNEETKTVVEKILAEYGAPDVVIHMACPPTTRKALEDTTEEEKRIEFSVAVSAAHILADTFLPHMKPGSAFIGITTASLDKDTPEKNIGAYLPAKAALRQLLNNLRSQWEEHGVRIIEIAPMFMPGGLNKHLPEGVRNLLARQKDGTTASAQNVAHEVKKLLTA